VLADPASFDIILMQPVENRIRIGLRIRIFDLEKITMQIILKGIVMIKGLNFYLVLSWQVISVKCSTEEKICFFRLKVFFKLGLDPDLEPDHIPDPRDPESWKNLVVRNHTNLQNLKPSTYLILGPLLLVSQWYAVFFTGLTSFTAWPLAFCELQNWCLFFSESTDQSPKYICL
jgi:hypothetical protein